MKRAVDTGKFEGLEIGEGKVLISHLQFANDTILMGKTSVKNAKAMRDILPKFQNCIGAKSELP